MAERARKVAAVSCFERSILIMRLIMDCSSSGGHATKESMKGTDILYTSVHPLVTSVKSALGA